MPRDFNFWSRSSTPVSLIPLICFTVLQSAGCRRYSRQMVNVLGWAVYLGPWVRRRPGLRLWYPWLRHEVGVISVRLACEACESEEAEGPRLSAPKCGWDCSAISRACTACHFPFPLVLVTQQWSDPGLCPGSSVSDRLLPCSPADPCTALGWSRCYYHVKLNQLADLN
ncbi:hypothetical protein K461DRAFT_65418 [Myriangium duriaei CBS 260.36]|uniref:Secreted protein n=1 Tax=Myriangium duriaei CBS 260.36 TaxID=1168546 RepID=A0A9P4IU42_9PEZI|nr:hypothetical protein K461DRAFT_65418 [Myriangium duriaei CBS 260.36]